MVNNIIREYTNKVFVCIGNIIHLILINIRKTSCAYVTRGKMFEVKTVLYSNEF